MFKTDIYSTGKEYSISIFHSFGLAPLSAVIDQITKRTSPFLRKCTPVLWMKAEMTIIDLTYLARLSLSVLHWVS